MQLTKDIKLPDAPPVSPFRAIIVSEESISEEQRKLVSDWLVSSGCVMMMVWGEDSSSWEHQVLQSKWEAIESGLVAENFHIMILCFPDEPLSDMFLISGSGVDMASNVLILHISSTDKKDELLAEYYSYNDHI